MLHRVLDNGQIMKLCSGDRNNGLGLTFTPVKLIRGKNMVYLQGLSVQWIKLSCGKAKHVGQTLIANYLMLITSLNVLMLMCSISCLLEIIMNDFLCSV